MRRPTTPLATLLASAVCASVLLGGCGDPDPGGPRSASAAEASPDAVATLIQAGLDQLTAGDSESARGTFRSVLTIDPGNVYAHYNLGLIAQRAGQAGPAATQYDAALDADPDFAPALFNRGILAEDTDLDEAIELYRRAVDADPTFAAAFMRLGFALVHLGRTEEGEEMLAKGVALDPSMANVEAPRYRD